MRFHGKKGIIAIYLFGSYAEGKKIHSNDIDIGILLDKTNQGIINERRKDCLVIELQVMAGYGGFAFLVMLEGMVGRGVL